MDQGIPKGDELQNEKKALQPHSCMEVQMDWVNYMVIKQVKHLQCISQHAIETTVTHFYSSEQCS